MLTVIEEAAPDAARERTRHLHEIGAETARVAHELKVPLSLIDGSLQTLEQYAAAAKEYIDATGILVPDARRLAALQADLDLTHLAENAPALFDIAAKARGACRR